MDVKLGLECQEGETTPSRSEINHPIAFNGSTDISPRTMSSYYRLLVLPKALKFSIIMSRKTASSRSMLQ